MEGSIAVLILIIHGAVLTLGCVMIFFLLGTRRDLRRMKAAQEEVARIGAAREAERR